LNALFLNELLTQKNPTTNSEFLPDDKVLALIKRSVKQRQDSIRQFEIGKRQDLADKEKAEMAILMSFLPASVTPEEISVVANRIVDDLKKKGMFDPKAVGKLTGLVMKELGGKADGNDVKVVIEGLVK
jgi:uncharacterized protein YqeY